MKHGYEEIKMGNPFKRESNPATGIAIAVVFGAVLWAVAMAFIRCVS
jgi:hypothetical protein